jgi:hypothetical protein
VARNVEDYYQDRPLMLQPFASAALTEGEYSLFWFNGMYSHAIVKVPQVSGRLWKLRVTAAPATRPPTGSTSARRPAVAR